LKSQALTKEMFEDLQASTPSGLFQLLEQVFSPHDLVNG
jgi:hypothetical protein